MSYPVFYTVAEVAQVLKVSEKTVRRAIAAGKIRVLRICHTVRVADTELARLQEAQQ